MTSGPDLDEWARRLAAACERSAAERANETELREDLDPLIREAARELYGLSEREITAERSPGRHGSRLRYDKAYGGLVVEWEWKMTAARRARGARQALDYLAAMRDDLGLDGAFTAVVCDGREWGFLASDPRPHSPRCSSRSSLSAGSSGDATRRRRAAGSSRCWARIASAP